MKTANKLARILYEGGVAIDVTTLENELRTWKNEILESIAQDVEALWMNELTKDDYGTTNVYLGRPEIRIRALKEE